MQHERCIIEPEEFIEYEGQSAILARLSDVLSSAQVTLILHHHTLELLASFKKQALFLAPQAFQSLVCNRLSCFSSLHNHCEQQQIIGRNG
ncbi:hypothetical protein ccbrp13_38150 [Ktedonobacteria bacterium brp13]|nr:hypothetical protein ccbrp13_38150 [Ktedonobacteria bacterium brp13]